MKRIITFSPLWILPVLVFLAACNNGTNIDPIEYGRSELHIVNVSQNFGDYDLVFDYFSASSTVISSMTYQRNWPIEGYADLQEGGQPAEDGSGKLSLLALSSVGLGGIPDTFMAAKPVLLNADEKATLCLFDSSGVLTFIKFPDSYATPADSDSVAAVRFINLKEAVKPAGLRVAGSSTMDISSIPWRSKSDFRTWDAGSYTLEAYADSSGATVATTSLEIQGGKVYTVLLSGIAGGDLTIYKH